MFSRLNEAEKRVGELKAIQSARGIRARVYNNANITLTNNTATALTFNSELYDTDAFHSTSVNTSRLTIPYDGYYRVTGNVRFAANATGQRQVRLLVNNTTIIGFTVIPTSAAANTTIIQVTSDYQFVASDYIELVALQDSGGNLDVTSVAHYSPEFWIDKLIN